MKFSDPTTWGNTFLPKPKYPRMTWNRWLMLVFAAALFVDQFFVPFHGKVDPGGAGDGMLFLIVAFRAVSKSSLPLSVVFAGGLLAALALTMNHGLFASPSWAWTPVGIFLILVVMFWHRRQLEQAEAPSNVATPDPKNALHLGDKRD